MVKITTIKIRNSTKLELDRMKEGSETYDVAVRKLVDLAKNKGLRNLLVEAYKSKADEDLKNLREWEAASGEVD